MAILTILHNYVTKILLHYSFNFVKKVIKKNICSSLLNEEKGCSS